ncbi:NAD(P)-dependent oxidoreductase [Dyadobacter sp. CY323]|uniref:NAD-dependent epimerase/dehydratase family protein n=1 Tax=Dyadobacter sp. CY323 TaxID=2907302 RepID=UPI001F20D1A1|nr:NAD-dependent epimerase/dehydratase family protein [Dyadobacter sp. CY323]MCE6990953.1 NAD-dependent epimerase/dehydratase family protein [Dyadobacter sp. CY323]
MKVLITGATGNVGVGLVPLLIENEDIESIGLMVRMKSAIPSFFYHPKCRLIFNDDNIKQSVKDYNAEVVLHLASYLTSSHDESVIDELLESNISFGTHLLDSLRDTNIRLFVNVGSFSEYHNQGNTYDPTYLYSATKHAFRSILKYYSEVGRYKTFHVVPYSIYGGLEPKKKIIDILIDALSSEHPIELSSGKQKLDFIHINDVVDFLNKLLMAEDQFDNQEIIHLGTGASTSLRELAGILESVTGKKLNVTWGAKRDRERDTVVSMSPISQYENLGWKPAIGIEDGLRKLLQLKRVL